MPEIKFFEGLTKYKELAPLQAPRKYSKKLLESFASTVDEANDSERQITRVYADPFSSVIQTEPSILTLNAPRQVLELDACFDQRNRLWVAWRDEEFTYLYWYDSAVNDFVTTEFPHSVAVILFMTDLNYTSTRFQQNYAVLMLQHSNMLYYRTQEERFTERWEVTEILGDELLDTAGMSTHWRIQIAIDGNYLGARNESMPDTYTIIVNDKFVGADTNYVVEELKNER